MANPVKLTAPCKFNAFLRVLGFDEASQKHNVFSLFVRSEQFVDEITLSEVPELRGQTRVIYVDKGGAQIEVSRCAIRRTLDWLTRRHPQSQMPGMLVHVKKMIPPGSGLGGGSSDAAAVINWFYGRFDVIPALRAPWREVAAELGSDIPFFLSGADWAYVGGIGDLVAPLPGKPPKHEIIITAMSCPTDAVFAAYRRLGPPETPQANDLAPAAFSVCPELKAFYGELRKRRPNAVMTGSGSAFACLSPFGDFYEQSAH